MTDWYLKLAKVKSIKTYSRTETNLKIFNETFGDRIISTVRKADIEEYQIGRQDKNALATIDMQVATAKAMINEAVDNDEIDGSALKNIPVGKTVAEIRRKCAGAGCCLLENIRASLIMPRHT